MNGHVFDIQRFSVHDGPGIRTTVFLAGCPLRCVWCQNPEAFAGATAPSLAAETVISEVLEDREYYATSGGGLTLSGGEPLLQVAFVHALLKLAKRHDLHTCIQTAGAVPTSALLDVLDLADLVQFDLKHMDTARHRELTGVGNERILENAVILASSGATAEFRMPLLPGFNDNQGNLEHLASFLLAHGVCQLHLVPYQRLYLAKYDLLGMASCADMEVPSAELMNRVVGQFRECGLSVSVDE